jgi:hypothetical protein
MVAPTGPGRHTGVWQIQASNGAVFGTRFDVVIDVPGAPTAVPPTQAPVGCQGTPFFNGFIANPATIIQGQTSVLTWGLVQNANAVFLTTPGGTQGVATPGQIQVKPNQTTQYTLTARCGNNQSQIAVTVFVQGPPCVGQPVFSNFTANPATIVKGQSTRLNWGLVRNATSVVLLTPNGASGVASPGNVVVTPTSTTTYTLVAYCYNTTAQRSVTVNVTSPVTPTPTPTPPRDQILDVQLARQGNGPWSITVRYFWSGGNGPAYMEVMGLDATDTRATTRARRTILSNQVKNVTLQVENREGMRPVKFQACMVGRSDTDLACRTVRVPNR